MQASLEPLDISDVTGISDWHERFQLYVITNDKITDKNKTAHYVSLIGKDAYRLLKDLAFPDKVADKNVADLESLLVKHLQIQDFELAEREKFHNLTKKPQETNRSFMLRVQRQAAKCNFGAALNDNLRDRLVAGVTEPDLKRKLLRESALTFASAKTILEDWDAVNLAVSQTEVLMVQKKPKFQPKRKS